MKIIMFLNTTESLEYFSEQLSKYFVSQGHEVFFYNCSDQLHSFKKLQNFIEPGNTVGFAFNFWGITDDMYLCTGREPFFWDDSGIPFVNMIVDHPYYYHLMFRHLPQKYTQICIDQNHISYMKRFFPSVDSDHFIELGGTPLVPREEMIPFENRKYNLVFTGNYISESFLKKHMSKMEPSALDFYNSMIDDLIADPDYTIEELVEKRVREEFGDAVNDHFLIELFNKTVAIDLDVRHIFRAKVITSLADAGFKISVFGAGYDQCPTIHPENLDQHGKVDSEKCLIALSNARASLNVMPWFKKGSHDRVFNSMLNGAASISDTSDSLTRHFKNFENIVFYDLKHINELPEIYGKLISDQATLKNIAEAGYEESIKNHTWNSRGEKILKILESVLAK